MSERLEELKKLKDGWHNGDGNKISTKALEVAEKELQKIPKNIISYIYPMFPDGVQIEFRDNNYDIDIEIESDGTVTYREFSYKHREKVIVYEQLLHDLHFASSVEMNHDRVMKLLGKISNWSYAHRQGNGELSDEEQNDLIEKAFKKLSER